MEENTNKKSFFKKYLFIILFFILIIFFSNFFIIVFVVMGNLSAGISMLRNSKPGPNSCKNVQVLKNPYSDYSKYGKRDNLFYLIENDEFYKRCQMLDVDHETFEYIGSNFAKDKNYVYWSTRLQLFKLPNADPKTFEIIFPNNDKLKEFPTAYSKDKKQVYLNQNLIEKANPITFEFIEGQNYFSKDDKYVFFEHYLTDIDPNNFIKPENPYKYRIGSVSK